MQVDFFLLSYYYYCCYYCCCPALHNPFLPPGTVYMFRIYDISLSFCCFYDRQSMFLCWPRLFNYSAICN